MRDSALSVMANIQNTNHQRNSMSNLQEVRSEFLSVMETYPNSLTLSWWMRGYNPRWSRYHVMCFAMPTGPDSPYRVNGQVVLQSSDKDAIASFCQTAAMAGRSLAPDVVQKLRTLIDGEQSRGPHPPPEQLWYVLLLARHGEYAVGGRPPHFMDEIKILHPFTYSIEICDALLKGVSM